jgi:thiol-disulfide isomerase/thioredoxin
MGEQFQMSMRMLAATVLVLLLSACAEELGVDQHGGKVTAAQLDGQWLVINYWAEWCAPCRTEIPELNALEQQFKGQGARVLGVNYDALQGPALSAASAKMGIEFTVLAQDPAPRYQLPRADVLPVTYIIDDKGRTRERLLGEQTAEFLSERLNALRDEG